MPVSGSTNSVFVPTSLGTNAFRLKHKGDPIFFKIFNGSSIETVDLDRDRITIKNHFFKTGEKLKYEIEEGGGRIGISPSSPGNNLSTTFLPEEVYPLVIDSDTISLAFSPSLAESNQIIDLTSVGIGTIQSLEAEKQNTKCLITIDNVIQSPVAIASTVGITDFTSSSLTLESLDNVKIGTTLKISNELVKITKINFEDKIVSILRGESYLGTPKEDFTSQTTFASILSGQYNIVKDVIYFTDAPFEGIKKKFVIPASELNFEDNSFVLFNSGIETGLFLRISSQNPPEGLEESTTYFAIKNFENNFSFAKTFSKANNEEKVDFLEIGGIDPTSPVEDIELTVIDISGQSSFSGRAFIRSDYSGNAVFDDFSEEFNGITTSFELKESGISTVGIKSENGIVLINNLFQFPGFDESFSFDETGSSTNLVFTGISSANGFTTSKDYDVNIRGLPRNGIIVSYGTSGGSEYQPQVPASLTVNEVIEDSNGNFIVDNDNIGIAFSGSGYRNVPGSTTSIFFEDKFGNRISGIGTAIIENGNVTSISMSVGSTFTTLEDEPIIKIDPPIPYSNIELSGSTNGVGARVSFKINIDGTISDLILTNPGYGYTVGEVLSIPEIVGKSTQSPSEELKFTVERVEKDTFSAWNIGILRKLDDLGPSANGVRRTFNIKENGELLSLESNPGSDIEISQNILVFVNDVLQIPDDSYEFTGGTQIIFSEAPPEGSSIKVYFYAGSEGDTSIVDVIPPIEIGDNVRVKKNLEKNPQTQLKRTVKRIIASDILKTEIYSNKGLSFNSFTFRPVDVIPQKRDIILGGEKISKSRESLNSKIENYQLIGGSSRSGTFVGINTNTVGIDTTSIEIGDYIESVYTEGITVISISSGEVGISAISNSPSGTNVADCFIWRKI
jgi:hypothetical protein